MSKPIETKVVAGVYVPRIRIYDRIATASEIADGYVEDESEDGICMSCKEHACPSYDVDESGEIGSDARSSCCGSAIHCW